MKFPGLTRFLTGILVTVSSLRTRSNAAVGEFLDLIPLADWCASVGLDLIQILPVNDTGSQSSPYSALSAFALHPIYIHLPAVSQVASRPDLLKRTASIRERFEAAERLPYEAVLNAKQEILHEAYRGDREGIGLDADLADWIETNRWVREYAVFKTLKNRFNQASWRDWPEFRDPTDEEISRFWAEPAMRRELLYHAWVQYLLEQQLGRAVEHLTGKGILLKGDLPILMNEDSTDLWFHRHNFILERRAGAPPDMFSDLGQNWGFPIYNWDAQAGDDYRWWRDRLRQADKFYNAYRIDHVLGFFRIWAIPETEFSGILGHFFPSRSIGREELNAAGFPDDRIRWLAEPHVPGHAVRSRLGDEAEPVLEQALSQIGDEDLYLFRPEITGEKVITSLPYNNETREYLLDLYRDRALLRDRDDRFHPAWSFRSCSRYETLSENEKQSFEALVSSTREDNERIWEENGRRLLRFMSDTVDMQACAEDLGVIPRSVPSVLESLGIYSLKLPRWNRIWDKPSQPFVPLDRYPRLSVCAASVHDTTTLREWWEKEDGSEAKDLFWKILGAGRGSGRKRRPGVYTPETAGSVIRSLLTVNSGICVFQIQDLFAIDPSLRTGDPSQERVNTPGTLNDLNWTYRTITSIESLSEFDGLNDTVRTFTEERKRRAL